jgi:hypothetical protein
MDVFERNIQEQYQRYREMLKATGRQVPPETPPPAKAAPAPAAAAALPPPPKVGDPFTWNGKTMRFVGGDPNDKNNYLEVHPAK